MNRHLFDCLDEVEARINGQDLMLLLDFDGTLTPIVEDPETAWIDPRLRDLLDRLNALPTVHVAILSGRRLDDVRMRVGLPGLVYSGNHGLEIRGPGFDFVHTAAVNTAGLLACVARKLESRLAHIPGVHIEDKVLTASVHYRRTPSTSIREVAETVHTIMKGYDQRLRVSRGLKVANILPVAAWTKGEAAISIRDAFNSRAVTICIGDDRTDEDAFRTLKDGVNVRVGCGIPSGAAYHLRDPAEVEQFLLLLAHQRDRRGHGDSHHVRIQAD